MVEFFTKTLYEPLFNLLIGIYHVLPWKDLGFAIIILTLIIKVLLFYPSLKQMRSQKSLQDAQPHIDALKKKYKDNKEELGKQIMLFYKENKVNPMSSCLPLLIQLPVLWALFKVFFGGLATDPGTGVLIAEQLNHLYEPLRTIYATAPIQHIFLGVINLAEPKNIVLAVLAGVVQFFQARMLSTKKAAVKTAGAKDEDTAATINKQMLYFLPIITVVFGYQFPAGVTLYWLFSTVFTWVQQLIFLKDKNGGKEMVSAAVSGEVVEASAKEISDKK